MTIKEYVYNEDEVFRLYSEAGWVAYTNDMAALREGFMNSLLILAAYGDDGLLGPRCAILT